MPTALDRLKAEAKTELPKLREALKEAEQDRETLNEKIKGIRSDIGTYEVALGNATVQMVSVITVDEPKKEQYLAAFKKDGKDLGWIKLDVIKDATGYNDATEKKVREELLKDKAIEQTGKRGNYRLRLVPE